jgi:heme exporter protein B
MTPGNQFEMALRLARKDVMVELRRPHELLSIVAFTLSSVIISSFSWRTVLSLDPVVVSAALWVILYFACILVLTTSFAREVDRGTIDGLRSLPCQPIVIIAGKIVYGLVILVIVLLSLMASSLVFLNLGFTHLLALSMVFLIGAVDLALIGSMMSAVLMYSEGKNLLLAFLFFPVSVPILLPGIRACAAVLSGVGLASLLPEVRLLLAYMLAMIAVSMTLFKELYVE